MKFGSSALCMLLAGASPFVASGQSNLYDLLNETEAFTAFLSLVDADFTNSTRDLLEGDIPLTLLAPTNEAVALINDEIMDWYMQDMNVPQLIFRLSQVIVPGEAPFDVVKTLDSVTALNLTASDPRAPGPIEYPVAFNSTSGELAIGVGKVIDSLKDLDATNGLIHGMTRMVSLATVLEQLGFDQIYAIVLAQMRASPPGRDYLARLQAGEITIFAPQGSDFLSIAQGSGGGGNFAALLQGMIGNPNFGFHLVALLGAHTVDSIFFLDGSVMEGDTVKNLNDADLTLSVEMPPPPGPMMPPPPKEFKVSPGITLVGGAPVNAAIDVIQPNVALQDGVIHAISGLIGSPFLALNILSVCQAAGYTKFVELVGEAGLTEEFNAFGITLFVPTNAALADVSGDQGDILKSFAVVSGSSTANIYPSYALQTGSYDTLYTTESAVVVEGSSVKFNGASVVATDLLANNGIVHVISSYATGPEGDDDDDDDSSAASKSLLAAALTIAMAIFM